MIEKNKLSQTVDRPDDEVMRDQESLSENEEFLPSRPGSPEQIQEKPSPDFNLLADSYASQGCLESPETSDEDNSLLAQKITCLLDY